MTVTLRLRRPPSLVFDAGDDDPRIGLVLDGRYRVVARIAEGGMGVVYRAERLGIGRAVAVKFLDPDAVASERLLRRFAIEARAASRLSHPGCVPVIDYGAVDGVPYLVMELVAGRSLREVLAAGPVAVGRALELGRQILAGLAHAHAHGVIHRDLKPDNVLVWSDALGEHAQLADFGLAKLDVGVSPASGGLAIGTPSYMSPEQTLGAPVDARSDVYGAGVLLFELLADRRPFIGEHPWETMQMHREAPVPALGELAPDRAVPAPVEAVIRRALAKAPGDRYRSAVEFVRALDEALASMRDDGATLTELLAESRPRRWGLAVLVLVLIGALAAAIALIAAELTPP